MSDGDGGDGGGDGGGGRGDGGGGDGGDGGDGCRRRLNWWESKSGREEELCLPS